MTPEERPTRGRAPIAAATVAAVLLIAAALLMTGSRGLFPGSAQQVAPARAFSVAVRVRRLQAGAAQVQIGAPELQVSPTLSGAPAPQSETQEPSGHISSAPHSATASKRRKRGVRVSSAGQRCSCSEDQSLQCTGRKTHLIQQAVGAICPMKADIRDTRQAGHCRAEAMTKAMGLRTPRSSDVPQSSDFIYRRKCPENITVDDSFAQQPKSRQIELIHESRRQLAAATLMSAITSASATLDLLTAPGQRDIFYDHHNMWWLRGWEKGRRHVDPFTKASVPFLPDKAPKPDRSLWGSCAVVGNSGVLLSQGLGDEISRHDTVIRVNQGPLHADYHQHVGNRTDVRILNRRITKFYATNAEYNEQLYQDTNATLIATRAATMYFERLGRRLQEHHPDKTLLFTTGAVVGSGYGLLASFRAGFEEATGIRFRGGNSPSTGLVAIMTASQMCSSVTAYGFALGNCLRDCPKYHYWSQETGLGDNRKRAFPGHQYDVEGWLMKALHVMGFVRIAPQPRKYLPEYDSRLAGLLTPEGSFSDTAILSNQRTLLRSDAFVDSVLGRHTAIRKPGSGGRRKPAGARGRPTRRNRVARRRW